jgi:hypothetical protein
MSQIHSSVRETTVTDELVARPIAGVKSIRILEMLALQQGQSLAKDVIADRLWEGNRLLVVSTLEGYVPTCVATSAVRVDPPHWPPLRRATCSPTRASRSTCWRCAAC